MPTVLKLHEPEHYDVIRKMIQHDYVFWLDVEMRKADDEPALVGYIPLGSKLSRVHHVLLDPSMEAVASMKRLPQTTWGLFVCLKIVPVIEAGGVVAAYSLHELELIKQVLLDLERPDMFDRLIYLDCNAAPTYRKFMRDRHQAIQAYLNRRYRRGLMSRPRKVGLKDYLMDGASSYAYPKYLRDFSPAEALAYIRPQAEQRRPRRWTPVAKRKLANLLTYNENDVRGMRHLTRELMQVGLVPEAQMN
jgi:hypothetical protein